MSGVKLDNYRVLSDAIADSGQGVRKEKRLLCLSDHYLNGWVTPLPHRIYQDRKVARIAPGSAYEQVKVMPINEYPCKAIDNRRHFRRPVRKSLGKLFGYFARRVHEIEHDSINFRDEHEHAAVVGADPSPQVGIVEVQSLLAINREPEGFRVISHIIERLIPDKYFLNPLFVGVRSQPVNKLRAACRAYVFKLIYGLMRKLDVVDIVVGSGYVYHPSGVRFVIRKDVPPADRHRTFLLFVSTTSEKKQKATGQKYNHPDSWGSNHAG